MGLSASSLKASMYLPWVWKDAGRIIVVVSGMFRPFSKSYKEIHGRPCNPHGAALLTLVSVSSCAMSKEHWAQNRCQNSVRGFQGLLSASPNNPSFCHSELLRLTSPGKGRLSWCV